MAQQDDRTLREARDRYFEDNGFGADGGYGEAWVDFKLGPIPFPFPNTKARVRAVGYHDLHHVLTGYRTDLPGELEISAWEIGAGCRDFAAAWVLNLGGMAGGALGMPRRTLRAFARGRRSTSLYGLPLDELLASSVTDARERTGVATLEAVTALDVGLFVAATLAGLAVGLVLLAVTSMLAPLGLVTNAMRRRAARSKPLELHGQATVRPGEHAS